ncbi:hypothetical protein [Streptomyces sp. SCL15-4]|uniref:hypothetical protein n=1 Tax=Streptomyces sp. SCL15-4 TaxID=2967221 RepID=UPI0029664E46|nr:hypothetical protein [Streptomyces sp. SCL15-4]
MPTASAVSGGAGGSAGAGGPYRGPVVDGSPEHAPVSDGGASAPGSHLPPAATRRTPPAAPPAYGAPQPQPHPQHPHPAYGYPQQTGAGAWGGARQAPAYQPYAGGLGSTPPYGPPDAGPPAEPERRSGRSTALLVVIALVVALGAGGSVYALMKNGSGARNQGSGPVPTHAATPRDGSAAPTATSAAPTPSTSRTSAAGSVPDAYLGTWRTTLGNAGGTGTRELTIRQGEVGDTVLTLVADGPAESGGSYHCVFEAELAEAPAGNGPLAIGPSTVTTGEPASSCTPGEATEITLLPDGRLKRAKASGGESLTYSKE